MANKRITDQTTDTALSAGDYIIVDSQAEGTRKFDLGTELSDIKQDLGDLSELETTVKTDLVSAINEVAESGGGGGSLATLSDVDIENVSNGQAITYDSSSSKWKNVTLGGGGGVTVDSALSTSSENPVQNKVITTALNGKADSSNLATVATSGSYADLSNTPTIPSSASDVGAIAAPSSPSSGDFLVYNGTAWVAQTLSTWQGGNY